jgi:hypothetical protein
MHKDDYLEYKLESRDNIKLDFKRNEPLRGEPDFTLIILEILMELYYKWVKNFLKTN